MAAFKAVEIRIREMANLGQDVIGVSMMRKAFGSNGALADPSRSRGRARRAA